MQDAASAGLFARGLVCVRVCGIRPCKCFDEGFHDLRITDQVIDIFFSCPTILPKPRADIWSGMVFQSRVHMTDRL